MNVTTALNIVPEKPLHARHAEELDDVLREPAGDALRDAQALALLEADVVVDVDDLAALEVYGAILNLYDVHSLRGEHGCQMAKAI